MALNVKVLNTYDNKAAAALAAYALSEHQEEMLDAFRKKGIEYSGTSQAFDGLGEVLCVKRNTIKNFCDAFDPHTSSHRKGWHKESKLKPAYLKDIYEYGQTQSRQDVIDSVIKLHSWKWLPDLEDAWNKLEKLVSDVPISSELDIPKAIRDRMVTYFRKEGYGIPDFKPTAIIVTSKKNNQESILPFAYLPKFKVIFPYIKDVVKYKELADTLKDTFYDKFPEAERDQQKLFKAIKKGTFTKDTFFKLTIKQVGSENTVDRLYKAFTNPEWGGINKSIFRGQLDVLTSVCQYRLNLENVHTGYVKFLIEYLVQTKDPIEELDLNGVSDISRGPDGLPRNVLFFGAPGTGKSHNAERFIDGKEEHFHRTVFFADYQNADFVGSVKPVMKGENVSYRFETGPLVIALKDALNNPEENVVLLIEEINRGNAPAIFGEMFQLLDRGMDGSSKYPIKVSGSLQECLEEESFTGPFRFPSNLFIIATMNAGDQGVFAMDTAFKRRWHFKYTPIDFDLHHGNKDFSYPKIQLASDKYSWTVFAKTVNAVLAEEMQVPEDRLLGPFFLSPTELAAENLTEAIAEKVLPYLWQDVLRYDDRTLLFDSNIVSFAQLQNGMKTDKQVFSDKFNSRLRSMAPQPDDSLQENSNPQNKDSSPTVEEDLETPRGEGQEEDD